MTAKIYDASFPLSASGEGSRSSALAAAIEVLRRLEEERDILLKDIEFQQQMIAELEAQAHLQKRGARDVED